MVLGGVITFSELIDNLEYQFSVYREALGMFAELKWTKVSWQKLDEYKIFLDIFFENRKIILFKSMVIDMVEFDKKRFHNNNSDLSFYKMMYQFLLHSFGRYLRAGDEVIIHLDERVNTGYKLSTLCAILNNGLHKKYSYLDHPIRSIQAIDSKKSNLMQLADILMGAIGYEWNGNHKSSHPKQSKIDLANYIKLMVGLNSLARDTSITSKHFSIWKIDFSKSKKNK